MDFLSVSQRYRAIIIYGKVVENVVLGLTLTIKLVGQKKRASLGGKAGKLYVIYPFIFFYQKLPESGMSPLSVLRRYVWGKAELVTREETEKGMGFFR